MAGSPGNPRVGDKIISLTIKTVKGETLLSCAMKASSKIKRIKSMLLPILEYENVSDIIVMYGDKELDSEATLLSCRIPSNTVLFVKPSEESVKKPVDANAFRWAMKELHGDVVTMLKEMRRRGDQIHDGDALRFEFDKTQNVHLHHIRSGRKVRLPSVRAKSRSPASSKVQTATFTVKEAMKTPASPPVSSPASSQQQEITPSPLELTARMVCKKLPPELESGSRYKKTSISDKGGAPSDIASSIQPRSKSEPPGSSSVSMPSIMKSGKELPKTSIVKTVIETKTETTDEVRVVKGQESPPGSAKSRPPILRSPPPEDKAPHPLVPPEDEAPPEDEYAKIYETYKKASTQFETKSRGKKSLKSSKSPGKKGLAESDSGYKDSKKKKRKKRGLPKKKSGRKELLELSEDRTSWSEPDVIVDEDTSSQVDQRREKQDRKEVLEKVARRKRPEGEDKEADKPKEREVKKTGSRSPSPKKQKFVKKWFKKTKAVFKGTKKFFIGGDSPKSPPRAHQHAEGKTFCPSCLYPEPDPATAQQSSLWLDFKRWLAGQGSSSPKRFKKIWKPKKGAYKSPKDSGSEESD